MSTYTSYSVDLEELTRLANVVKENLLNRLEAAGCVLPEETKRWTVVTHRCGTLGALLDKLRGRTGDGFWFTVLEEK